MGCDIHLALGKIKQLAIGHTSNEHALMIPELSKTPVVYSQFEFLNYGDVTDWEADRHRRVSRHYQLFAWLANVRGELEPLMREKNAQLNELARRFVEWATGEQQRVCDEAGIARGDYEEHFDYKYVDGDHSHMVYPIPFLRDFDYNQQVRLRPAESWEGDDYRAELVKHYQGKTYRDIFPAGWFGFLDWAFENGWHFTIISFDN